jgi:hypothetical protein
MPLHEAQPPVCENFLEKVNSFSFFAAKTMEDRCCHLHSIMYAGCWARPRAEGTFIHVLNCRISTLRLLTT